MGRVRRLVVAGLVVLLAACTGPAPAPAQPWPAGGTLASFYSQRAAWSDCDKAQCATLRVPLDYANPEAASLALPLRRVAATAEPRLGTLFVEPGGPGMGSTALGNWFDATGLGQYDIVYWDPRGVAVPQVSCLAPAALDAYLELDRSPDTAAERDALAGADRAFGEACERGTAAGLLDHLSSADAARDLDIMRASVGDESLSLYAASYGTVVGLWYARLFPARVGRMALDSPSALADPIQQTAGPEANLHAFADWCADDRACDWGRDGDAVFAAIADWLRSLDSAPVPAGGSVLTQSQAVWGVWMHFYGGPDGWPALRDALAAARHGDGAPLLAAADRGNGRRPDGTYSSLAASGMAILCADLPRIGAAEAEREWAEAKAAAPLFGDLAGPQAGCVSWPATSDAPALPAAQPIAPALIIGATGDPATPYPWARTTADAMPGSRLLTFDGFGHVSYGRSACVDAAVRAYLTAGTLPAEGTSCQG